MVSAENCHAGVGDFFFLKRQVYLFVSCTEERNINFGASLEQMLESQLLFILYIIRKQSHIGEDIFESCEINFFFSIVFTHKDILECSIIFLSIFS